MCWLFRMAAAVHAESPRISQDGNWVASRGDRDGSYWSKLGQINQNNVAELGPDWWLDFDTQLGQESEPSVIDGVMYVSSA